MTKDRLEQLLKFLDAAPEDSFTLYSIAYEYMQMGDHAQAIAFFQRLLKTDPAYLGAYYQLGQVLAHNDQKEEAVAVFEAGIKLARQKKDTHTLAELNNARNNLLYEDDIWNFPTFAWAFRMRIIHQNRGSSYDAKAPGSLTRWRGAQSQCR